MEFLEAVGKGTPEALQSLVKEVTPGVFAFTMFHPTFCRYVFCWC
jgi:hypothetical protein